jgi:pimeloyl-ACP methyl ester carboxylesterase
VNTAQVQTPHGALAVTVDGSGDNTVILLHGLGGDHNQALGFAPPASALDASGRAWRKVGVDMRGHGDTTALGSPDTLTHQAFTEDLAAVLRWAADTDGRAPVGVVGMSMGAELALQAALRYPDLVRSLVIIRPSGPGAPPGPMTGVYPVIADYLRRLGPEGKAPFQRSPEYQAVARRTAATAASLLRQFDRPAAQARVAVLECIPKSTRVTATELGQIGVPALVCVSPGDPAHEMRCGRIIAQRLPRARPLVILPQKKTTPGAHEETLREVAGAFLTEQAAGAPP